MNVLSHREQYRRLYSLPVHPAPGLRPDTAVVATPVAAQEEVAPAPKAPARKAARVSKRAPARSKKAASPARKKAPAKKRASR
jgi:hypothetical protein